MNFRRPHFSPLVALANRKVAAVLAIMLFGFAAVAQAVLIPVTLVVTGPFAADGTTALVTANNSATIKYNLTLTGANRILSNSAIAEKIMLMPFNTTTGTIEVTGSGNTSRTVTLTNVTGNGDVKIWVRVGIAYDSADKPTPSNEKSKTFILDNVVPTSTSILINAGAPAAKSSAVTLTLAATGATQMYITNTPGCTSGGTYQAFAKSKSWTLAQSNSAATVYVKFKDAAGNQSACINDVITHDSVAPTFTVSGPSQANANAKSTVTYTVIYTGASKAITLAPKDITVNATGLAGFTAVASGTVKVIPDVGVGCKPGPCSVAPDPTKRFVVFSSFKNNGTLGIAIKEKSATDVAGNFAAAGTANSTTFNVDTGIPAIVVGNPSIAEAKANSTVTYAITYRGVTNVTLSNSSVTRIKTGTANASHNVTDSAGAYETGTVVKIVTLSGFTGNGTITIAVPKDTATDTAGNLSPAPANPSTFNVDTVAPGAPILPALLTFNSAFLLKFSKALAPDASFKEIRYATAQGTSVTAPADCASGTKIDSGSGITLSTNTTSIAAIACDKAGNKSAATTRTYTFDNEPPTISVSAPSVASANSTSPGVSFTVTYTGADKISLNKVQITPIYTGDAWPILAPIVSMDTAVPPNPLKRIVTLKNFRGIGTLGISIAAGSASDNAGNLAPAPSPTVSQTFDVVSAAAPASSQITATSPERKTFFDSASGYHWAFWYSGSNVSYGYSSNGTTFSTTGSPLPYNTPRFTVTTRNGTVLIAYENGFDIMVRRGTISCTSIIWESAVTALDGTSTSDAFSKPAMTVGGDNSLYIAGFQYSTASGFTPKATRSTGLYTGGLMFDAPAVAGAPTASPVSLALVPQGSYAMAFSIGVNGSVQSYAFNGVGWYLNNLVASANSMSVTSDSGGVKLAYVDSINSLPYYTAWNGMSWTTRAQAGSNVVTGPIALATSSDSSNWLVGWERGGQIEYRRMQYMMWDMSVTTLSTGTDNHFPVLPEVLETSSVPMVYTKGSSSNPYQLTAAPITFSGLPASTPGSCSVGGGGG